MESLRDSTTFEEEIYWKNFHFAQFCIILPSEFQQSLTLPKKFTYYMRPHIPDNAILKVNGVTWNVCLEKCKDYVMLKGHGWLEFAKAYSLRKGDMVMFKYDRRECFEIMIFDGTSSCEKEASYFVRKSQSPQCENVDSEGVQETSSEFIDTSQQGDYDSDYAAFFNKLIKKTSGSSKRHSSAKAANNIVDIQDGDCEEASDKQISISEQRRTQKKASSRRVREVPSNALRKRKHNDIDYQDSECEEASDKKISTSAQHTTQKKASRRRVRDVPSNSQRKRKCNGVRTTPRSYQAAQFKSNRRSVTEEEKLKALEMARKRSADHKDSFFVVMRPTSVYRRFFMTIPRDVRFKTRLKNGQKWILEMEDKTWSCSVYEGGLQGAGWMTFAVDNILEEFDVCLFVPKDQKNGDHVFDVSLFRVVPEAVSPTRYQ